MGQHPLPGARPQGDQPPTVDPDRPEDILCVQQSGGHNETSSLTLEGRQAAAKTRSNYPIDSQIQSNRAFLFR